MSRLVLIDGKPVAYMAYQTMALQTKSSKVTTSVIFGFLRSLERLCKKFPDSQCIVCWDKGKSRFRTELYPEYKAGRTQSRSSELGEFDVKDFHDQIARTQEVLKTLGVPQLIVEGVEADDDIAILCNLFSAHFEQIVVSGQDHDLWQLLENPKVVIYDSRTENLVDAASAEARYGVPPKWLPDYKALVGDSSDNIPGAEGVGEKSAIPLLTKFGGLEGIYFADPEEVKKLPRGQKVLEQKDTVRRWYDLILSLRLEELNQIERESLTYQVLGFATLEPDFDNFVAQAERYEFSSILNELDGFLSTLRAGTKANTLQQAVLALSNGRATVVPRQPVTVVPEPVEQAQNLSEQGFSALFAPQPAPAKVSVPPVEENLSTFEKLDVAVLACKACTLRLECSAPVLASGFEDSPIMVVGRNPGATEDSKGAPFVGKAGQELNRFLDYCIVSRTQHCFVSNSARCYSKDNRQPTESELLACRRFLQAEVSLLQPKLILAFGNEAMRALTGRTGITKFSGQVFSAKDCYGPVVVPEITVVIPVIHPSGALRQQQFMDQFLIARETVKYWLSTHSEILRIEKPTISA